MRLSFLIAIALSGPAMAATDNVRSLNIVNNADTAIVALATATHGSPWLPLELSAGSLRRGNAVNVSLAADSCLRDFRAVFADATALVLRDFDICRENRLDPSFYRPRMHLHRARASARSA